MTRSFYWYDYETTGIDPRRDRVVQFAGLRTDQDFQPIGSPQTFYCRLHDDVLPHPEACLVTGISPQLANQKGLSEPEFCRRIEAEFSQPDTCVVGYNNIRFDDEFTRNLFYRNFYDPYAREWKSGNSRWDLIDVIRMTEALRPDGIVWPKREDGAPSFRLEELTQMNGIVHEAAHDALSDVHATIGMAHLIKQRQPRLFEWALGMRNKHKVADLLSLKDRELRVHVSGKYLAAQHSLAVIMPLIPHPQNSNGVVVYDARVDPEPFLHWSADAIRERLYTAAEDLAEGQTRIPLKTVHLNKSPMLAPVSTLDSSAIDRLKLDLDACQRHREKILNSDWFETIRAVFDQAHPESDQNPDLQIYSGGFFSSPDRRRMDQIPQMSEQELAKAPLNFEDQRIPEMLFRYRARNFPLTLNAQEKSRWQQLRRERLTQTDGGGSLTLDGYFKSLDHLVSQTRWSEQQVALIESLLEYGEQIVDSLEQHD